MAIDPEHIYSDEAERDNQYIYADFKKNFGHPLLYFSCKA